MKSSHTLAAPSGHGLFNTRTLRAAALLPIFGAGALFAADAPPAVARPADPVVPAKAADAKTDPKVEAKPDVAPVSLGKTIVIASRREEKLEDVSPSFSVITKDEIQLRQFHTLGEVLASQPGVMVAGGTAPLGSNISIFTRGTESNATAVLLDGRRLNPGLDGSSEIQRYTTTGLDSVQFARGATSTLYGANALGGVIDMRSIDPLKLTKPEGFAEVEAGSFSSVRSAASVAGATSVLSSDGRNDLGAAVSGNIGYTDGPVDNQDFRGNNGLVHLNLSPVKPLTFELIGQVHDQQYGNPTSFGVPSPEQRQLSRGWLLSPGVIFDNGDDVTGKIFYSRSESTIYNTDPTFGTNESHLDTVLDEVSVQVDWQAANWLLFSTGYSYLNTDYNRTSTFGDNHIAWSSNAVWERVTLSSADKATKLGFGARYEAFDDFTDKGTGEAFASHDFGAVGTSVYAKIASAYSTPTAQDYFFTPPAGELRPESVRSWEIGAKQKLFTHSSPLELGAVYFDNKMTDLISFNTSFQSFNVDKARARGVELTADWVPVKQIKVFANGTIQDARVTADSPTSAFNQVFSGDKLARRPDYTTTFGVEFTPVESVTFGISGTGVMGREDTGHRDMGDYFVARVYGTWRFNRYAELFGRLENIGDEQYDASGIGFEGLPFGAYAGLRLRF